MIAMGTLANIIGPRVTVGRAGRDEVRPDPCLHRCMTITVPGVSAVVTNMVGRVVSVSASM